MEVILLDNVANLGFKDDVVKVRDGYGRNYLIPNKLAVIANDSALKVRAENLRQRAHKLEKIKNDAIALAEQLKNISLTINAKASESGKIFGAVTPLQLSDALAAQGLVVDRKVIALDEPVKELGEYKAVAHLHKDVTADIHFVVVAE